MTREEIQIKIDKTEQTPEDMRLIAESYLRGDIIKDLVAAEAWFFKVIETGDNKDAMISMMLLAKKILGKEYVISKKELEDLERKQKLSEGEEKIKLNELLEIIKRVE